MILAWLSLLALALPALAAAWLALTSRPRAALGTALGALLALGLGVALGGDDLALQKVVSALVMPVGLLWLAMLGTTLWAWAQGPRALARATASLWLLLTVISNPWVSNLALGWLEAQVPVHALPADAPLDVIVVPGGGAGYAADGVTAQVGDFGDRVVLAARLYRTGKARRLVTTGSSISGISAVQDLTQATRAIWLDLGIPDDAITGLPEPKNTSQEIAAVKALASREQWRRVGMLGSAYHLPRILALCARAGLDVVPIAADRRAGPMIFHPLYAVPSAGALRTLSIVAWEAIGRAVGR